MAFKFLHVGFGPDTVTSTQRVELEKTLNEATDWYRYHGNSYILWTSQLPKTWSDKIRATAGLEAASFIIFPIDVGEKWGYQQKSVWEWLEKQR